jgi:hypothetical protein
MMYMVRRWGTKWSSVIGAVVRENATWSYNHYAKSWGVGRIAVSMPGKGGGKNLRSWWTCTIWSEKGNESILNMQLALSTYKDNWGEYYYPQKLFNPDEMDLKFSNEVEAVVALYKKVYKDMRKKAKQLKITSASSFSSSKQHMSCDYHHNIQLGTKTCQ